MKKVYIATVAAFAALCAAFAHATIQSNTQLITHILYNGSIDFAFFIGTGPWTAQGCSSTYAQIHSNVPGKDKLLAVAMMAYASGKKVSFYGDCNTNPAYFDVMYITVSD
jgi:hypothetical protein